jgi:hypothetical protein
MTNKTHTELSAVKDAFKPFSTNNPNGKKFYILVNAISGRALNNTAYQYREIVILRRRGMKANLWNVVGI